ncbi:MAG: tyrosine-type recombinase/integrase [Muribaculaceae bacterium]
MMIEGFLKYLRYELNYSVHTVLSYGNDLRQFVEFLTRGDSEQLRLDDVSVNDIREWMMSLSNAGDCQRTIRRKVQSVRALYKYMQRRALIDRNPATMVELAKLPKRLPTYVRSENINAMLDEDIDLSDFTAVRNRLMLLMFYETGIRRAELIGLSDVNVDASAMQIKVHGKRNKDRIVPFGSELLEWIVRYRELRSQQVAAVCDAFFVRPNGKALYPSLVYNVVHDALQAAGGTDKFSPHVLRHSFASAMLNNGAQLNNVKELLGHESLAATQVYTHITFSELKDNYQSAHPRALKKGGHYGN